MPIYLVVCDDCGYKKEIICNFNDLKDLKCGKCGSVLRQQVASVAFKVNGYSAENGYSRPEICYDGSEHGW